MLSAGACLLSVGSPALPSSTWQHGSVTKQHCARACRTAHDGTYIANGVAVVVSRCVVVHFGALLPRHLLHQPPTHAGGRRSSFKFARTLLEGSRRNKKSSRRGRFCTSAHSHAHACHPAPRHVRLGWVHTPVAPVPLPAACCRALSPARGFLACVGVCAELQQWRRAGCLAGPRRPVDPIAVVGICAELQRWRCAGCLAPV